jgi:N-acetylmuramoyl-L-alanine amidase
MTMTTDGANERTTPKQAPRSVWAITLGVAIGTVAMILLQQTSGTTGSSPGSGETPIAAALSAPASSDSPPPTTATAGPLDPAEFADGACVAQPPTSGDRHQTVFVDAGHGGPDPGATGGITTTGQNFVEKVATLPVALDAAQHLRAEGFQVVLSRTGDTSVARLTPDDLNGVLLTTAGDHADLTARAACANLAHAAALVSIHFDSFSDPSVGGATTLYDTGRSFSAANQALAAQLQQEIVGSLATNGWQVPDRGLADDSTAAGGEITAVGEDYGHLALLGPVSPGYVDNPSTMPGALVEPLFLTDPTEGSLAMDPTAQQAIATGIAVAIRSFLQTP